MSYGFINKLIDPLLGLNRSNRRRILIATDAILLPIVMIFTFWIYPDGRNFSEIINSKVFWIIPVSILMGIPLFILTGQYRGLSKYYNSKSFYSLFLRNSFLVLLTVLFGVIFNLKLIKFKNWVIFWLILNGSSTLIRIFLRDLQIIINKFNTKVVNKIVIYGAGEAGAQLASSMRFISKWRIICFIDDNPKLWGRCLQNKVIYSPNILKNIGTDIDLVCLAMPTLLNKRKIEIVNQIKKQNINVLQIPSLSEIMSGKSLINDLIPLNIEELLRRDQVEPDINLLRLAIDNKVICITGGAGSIGSELCFQAIKFSPKRIILIDNSELNVYKMQQKLNETSLSNNNVKLILGDISQPLLISEIFSKEEVDIVFHAAAYKHVPLVENNPISGIKNNSIATKIICEACIENDIKNVVLISTDKAVRPTNVMGASKRLSELIFKSYSIKENEKLLNSKSCVCFSIVRFGNVLNSSGSVVPLFKKQILEGGPITITHKNIIRYFMSIEEAAQLVIQTISLAKGGDIFLLDMGKPKKIQDLAMQMIELYGLTLKTKDNTDGDIEIVYSGLRPGEKLYEELLIDGSSQPTNHPLIYTSNERSINPDDVFLKTNDLIKKCELLDEKGALLVLKELVQDWNAKTYNALDE